MLSQSAAVLEADNGRSYVKLTAGDRLQINAKDSSLRNEKTVKLLGITVDNKLSFELHLKKLFKKISQKIYALARVSKFISQGKLSVIMRVFITSQFSYCPLV